MSDNHAKVLIIGSGPAGLTAAIYAARADLEPVLIEGYQPGGQLTITTDVENYPGFADGVQGPELMERTKAQAERFGTRFVFDQVVEVDLEAKPIQVKLEDEEDWTCDALIVCSGASAKLLNIPSETELMGYGVSACATCDGFFFKDREVVVIGGGDTAMEEASYLAKMCSKVTVIHRRDELRASKIMQQRALDNPKIEWAWSSSVKEFVGTKQGGLEAVILESTKDGSTRRLDCGGAFVAIGHKPNTDLFADKLEMDDNGYLITAADSTATSAEGVWAAGDVQDHVFRQAVTAAGTGCMAAIEAERWLALQGIE